jgi:ATP-dependent DNA ligase
MQFRAQWAKDVGHDVATVAAKCADPILEPKYDGWRCIVVREPDRVGIYKPMRNSDPAKCYTGQLPELEAELMKLPVGTALDGELVAMRLDVDAGRWEFDFFRIHTAMRSNETTPEQRAGIRFVAFDAPEEPGFLADRRACVESLLVRNDVSPSAVALTIQMDATQENHDALVAMGFEGSVVKDQAARYGFGKRGHGWFKIKATTTIDCVVMDVVMDGKGRNEGLAGRMVVGQRRQIDSVRWEWVEVAKVNCLNDAQRREATEHPERFIGQVLEVKVYGWTVDGPRHPTPLRFRGDKDPVECVWSRS